MKVINLIKKNNISFQTEREKETGKKEIAHKNTLLACALIWSDTYRVQWKVKHDNMIYLQVQSPRSQVSADQCGAISIITLKLFEVLDPASQRIEVGF